MAEEGERKAALEMVQADGTDGNCVTFVLHDEDHTLGNSLRYMVMKNPDVEFCGYCITHPSESKINFRIQTRGSLPAVEPFRKGLNDLMGVCQHVLSTFEFFQTFSARPWFDCGFPSPKPLGLGKRKGEIGLCKALLVFQWKVAHEIQQSLLFPSGEWLRGGAAGW
nr:DNA-directed RNA polymerases I and III subunit RPAC2-like isoform X1 [Anser cygnoides]